MLKFIAMLPSAVSTPTPPPQSNIVEVLVLIGASDMAGAGANFDGQQVHNAGDFAPSNETDANPNVQIWNPIAMGAAPSGWQDLTFSKAEWNEHNNNAIILGIGKDVSTIKHGRELPISNRLSQIVNVAGGEKLYIIKYGESGRTYEQLLSGTPTNLTMWNTYIVPAINDLLAAGKTPRVYIIIDSITGIFATGHEYFDLDAYIYNLKSLFGSDAPINISVVDGAVGIGWVDENLYGIAYANANGYDYVDETNFETIADGDGHHSYLGIQKMADIQVPQIASARTSGVAKKSFKEITNPLTPITTTLSDFVFFRASGLGGDITPSSSIFNLVTDVSHPFTIDVFYGTNHDRVENTNNYSLDVSAFPNGIAIIESKFVGLTHFECSNIGISYTFNIFFNNKSTLKYIDVRESNFKTFFLFDTLLAHLAPTSVTNGTLLILGGKNVLTVAAQADYDTLITKGWTIDAARPI